MLQLYEAPPGCPACPRLCSSRITVVNGSGPLPARVLVVAQNPGRAEEQDGYPLSERGWSGSRVRDVLLPLAGLAPSEVRFENIIRCRPPRGKTGDLAPNRQEVESCVPFLQASIAACQPEFIVTLGSLALAWFLPRAKLSVEHGQVLRWSDGGRDILIVPMYHPASAHPTRNPGLAEVIMEDWNHFGRSLSTVNTDALGDYVLCTREEMQGLVDKIMQETKC